MSDYHTAASTVLCRAPNKLPAAIGGIPASGPTGGARTRQLLTNGNSKLGRGVHAFSLPRLASCPGASEWCREHCYMANLERIYKAMHEAYHANFRLDADHAHELEARIRSELVRRKISTVRLHVDGDFHRAGYVRMWTRIALAFPDVRFFTYTRSWTVKRLRKALDVLRAVPNVTVFASVDPTMPTPPADWPVAWIDGDARAKGPICPEQRGRKATCSACGLCFSGKIKNIRFVTH
jgi:Gene product 88